MHTKINGHTFLCRNGKFQLSCLINSETILHGIKQWPPKQFYMNTLYSWQELKDWFMVVINLYTLPLSFSSQLQDNLYFVFFLFLASHIHECTA